MEGDLHLLDTIEEHEIWALNNMLGFKILCLMKKLKRMYMLESLGKDFCCVEPFFRG
jgi:hypothetical protein